MARRTRPYLLRASFRPDVELSYDEYPLSIPAVRELDTIDFHPNVTFFVGENGSGKSTVLEAIAMAMGFGPQGGTRNVQFTTAESTSKLHALLRPSRSSRKPKDGYFLRAESFFNVASYMDEVGYLQSYGNKSLHAQSHGESFMALMTHKLRGDGL